MKEEMIRSCSDIRLNKLSFVEDLVSLTYVELDIDVSVVVLIWRECKIQFNFH
jgi:hypothetical protein